MPLIADSGRNFVFWGFRGFCIEFWPIFIQVRFFNSKLHLGVWSRKSPKYANGGRCPCLLDRHVLLVPQTRTAIPLLRKQRVYPSAEVEPDITRLCLWALNAHEYIIMRVLHIKWVPEMQCAVWWAVPSKCAVVEKMLGSTAVGPIVGSIEERILLAMLPEELNNGSHWIANFRYI